MPNIKLGPAGSETTLPAINWDAGGDYNLPTGFRKNTEKATMLDGSVRVNIKGYHQRTWELEWAQLTAANVIVLKGLAELNQVLRFQDNRVDATWKWVYVAGLDIDSIESTHAGTALYRVALTLEEVS